MKNTNLVKAILVVTALVSVCALTACSALGQAQPIAGTQSGVLAAEAAVRSAGGLQTPAGTQAPGANRLEQIQARGYIEVATEPYFAPCEFIDPAKEGDEKYVGADIELAELIAETLGVECRIVPLEFTAVLSSVTEGKYDMAISAVPPYFFVALTAVCMLRRSFSASKQRMMSMPFSTAFLTKKSTTSSA